MRASWTSQICEALTPPVPPGLVPDSAICAVFRKPLEPSETGMLKPKSSIARELDKDMNLVQFSHSKIQLCATLPKMKGLFSGGFFVLFFSSLSRRLLQ